MTEVETPPYPVIVIELRSGSLVEYEVNPDRAWTYVKVNRLAHYYTAPTDPVDLSEIARLMGREWLRDAQATRMPINRERYAEAIEVVDADEKLWLIDPADISQLSIRNYGTESGD